MTLATTISDALTLFMSAARTSISLSVAHTLTHTLPTSADSVTAPVARPSIRVALKDRGGEQRVFTASSVRGDSESMCSHSNLQPGSINTAVASEPDPEQPSGSAAPKPHVTPCRRRRRCCSVTENPD